MLTIRAMSNGRGYAAHHLQHSDYYAEGQRVVGYWQGPVQMKTRGLDSEAFTTWRPSS